MPTEPIAFRVSDDMRAALHRVAADRGQTMTAVMKELIAERLPELAREGDLIDALGKRCSRLTIALSSNDGPHARVTNIRPNGATIKDIAVVQARRRSDQVAIELVGVGEFAGCRILLMVAPVGRRVRFEVVPADLTPADAA